jgi:hypothetical protein
MSLNPDVLSVVQRMDDFKNSIVQQVDDLKNNVQSFANSPSSLYRISDSLDVVAQVAFLMTMKTHSDNALEVAFGCLGMGTCVNAYILVTKGISPSFSLATVAKCCGMAAQIGLAGLTVGYCVESPSLIGYSVLSGMGSLTLGFLTNVCRLAKSYYQSGKDKLD